MADLDVGAYASLHQKPLAPEATQSELDVGSFATNFVSRLSQPPRLLLPATPTDLDPAIDRLDRDRTPLPRPRPRDSLDFDSRPRRCQGCVPDHSQELLSEGKFRDGGFCLFLLLPYATPPELLFPVPAYLLNVSSSYRRLVQVRSNSTIGRCEDVDHAVCRHNGSQTCPNR